MNGVIFWTCVEVGKKDECWNWKLSVNGKGYGLVRMAGCKTTQKSHRIAWVLTNGRIPGKEHVLHNCDNPRCCNPSHLRLGTNKDNANDRKIRGRQQRGENTARAALTVEKVRGIRRRYALDESLSMSDLAKEYKVCPATIHCVINYISWPHIDPEGIDLVPHRKTIGERTAKAKLVSRQVIGMRKEHMLGKSCGELANKYGLSRASVHKIVTGKSWKHLLGQEEEEK